MAAVLTERGDTGQQLRVRSRLRFVQPPHYRFRIEADLACAGPQQAARVDAAGQVPEVAALG